MANEAINVIDAGKAIAGLMSGEDKPAETKEEQPTEVAEEATETVEQEAVEETVNPSDVPYIDQETEEVTEQAVEQEAQEDIDETSEEPAYVVKVDGRESGS